VVSSSVHLLFDFFHFNYLITFVEVHVWFLSCIELFFSSTSTLSCVQGLH
jgi:hypothetical protein